jgi:hypothetical protein
MKDNDIDTLLVQQGGLWRAGQTQVEQPFISDVDAAKPRSRFVPLLAAATVPLLVAASALLLARWFSSDHHVPVNTAVVPWADPSPSQSLSGGGTVLGPDKWVLADGSESACNNSVFSVRAVERGPVGSYVVAAEYAGTSPCRISADGPVVVLQNRAGGSVLNGRDPELVGHLKPLLVSPGQLVRTTVRWSSWCGPSINTPVSFSLDFQASSGKPSTLTMAKDFPGPPPSCAPQSVSVVTTATPRVFNPGSIPSLVPTIDVPASAHAGQVLHYTVTLHNLSSTDVSLTSCPRFEQRIGHFGTTPEPAKTTHQLNCADSPPDVAAGQSITFAMQQTVPPNIGRQQVWWNWAGRVPSDDEGGSFPYVTVLP